MYYITLDNDELYGFFNDDGDNIDDNTIYVNEELFNYLCHSFGLKKYKGVIGDNILTMDDVDMFDIGEVKPIPTPSETELLNDQIQTLKKQISDQDTLININMMATDEIFTLIEPLINDINPIIYRKEVITPMVELYVTMVIRGLKTIEQVPVRYREQVIKILEELEK